MDRSQDNLNVNGTNLPGNRPSVLFVCTANMCRSPMAEGLFKAFIEEHLDGWEAWRIASAGTWTEEGHPAVKNAVETLAKRGIDISGHKTRPVNHVPLTRFRLILTMEAGHKEALQIEFPTLTSRVFLLSEMIDKNINIKDPIGKPLEEFEKTARGIELIFEKGIDKIKSLVTT